MARRIPALKARRRFRDGLLLGMVFGPLRLFCDHCDKYVPSNIEWICGYCDRENTLTRVYSFLNTCQHCKRRPNTIVCPHCTKPIVLEKGHNGANAARKSGVTPIVTPELDPRTIKRQKHAEEKEDKEQEIVLARLDAELAKAKALVTSKTETSVKDKLEKSFADTYGNLMTADDIVERELKLIEDKYKDNPAKKAQATEAVLFWREKQS